MENFEEVLMKRLDVLDAKLDEVRTVTLPSMKIDMALMAERDRTHNRIFSGVASLVAIVASVFVSDIRK